MMAGPWAKRRWFVAALFSLAACGRRAQTPLVATDTIQDPGSVTSPPIDSRKPPRPLGAFAVYRLLGADVFPEGPQTLREALGPSTSPEPSPGWSWGIRLLPDGSAWHYLNLRGEPHDEPHELLRGARAPFPTFPPAPPYTCLIYYGFYLADLWRFSTVAIEGTPVLTAEDLASCTIEDAPHAVNGVRTMDPSIHIHWTSAGQRKLRALPRDAMLTVAFGDDALTDMWSPDITETSSKFPVQGTSSAARRARALAIASSCEEQRKEGVRDRSVPVNGCTSSGQRR